MTTQAFTRGLPRGISDLEVCRRELAFGRAELEDAESAAGEAELKRQFEIGSLRREVHTLGSRVSAAYLRGVAEGTSARRALQGSREDLDEMYSEVLLVEAEAQFATAAQRRQRDEVVAARNRKATMCKERDELEVSVERLQRELREASEQCDCLASEESVLEDALVSREKSVAKYEVRAKGLESELRQVFEELRASHESARCERQRLAAHVATLERQRRTSVGRGGVGAEGGVDAPWQGIRGEGVCRSRMSVSDKVTSQRIENSETEVVPWWNSLDTSISNFRATGDATLRGTQRPQRSPPTFSSPRFADGGLVSALDRLAVSRSVGSTSTAGGEDGHADYNRIASPTSPGPLGPLPNLRRPL
eukprot:TRINITY_DN44035_c0_g1_i1.p1 TRINITY_DN44035_c0_g1~~TRINITY_DN44035_c0_g1_i1.p1  ORF type:complete len:364 (+),score=54.88 TRINITY_DN44035_c0_g1_i1:135-1226(+)